MSAIEQVALALEQRIWVDSGQDVWCALELMDDSSWGPSTAAAAGGAPRFGGALGRVLAGR